MDKAVKLFLWLMFTVAMGTSPLFVRFIASRLDKNPISWSGTLANGDLLIVGAVVAADAIGKIIGVRHNHGDPNPHNVRRAIRVVCGSSCLLLLVLACAEYSQVSGRIDAKVDYNTENVVHDSFMIFAGVVAAGLGVILVVEEQEGQ